MEQDASHHIEQYAKLSCRALCDRVCTTLPPEIEAEIWTYLSTPASGKARPYSPFDIYRFPQTEPIPHIWDVGFLGRRARQEHVWNFCRTVCFPIPKLDLLDDFLQSPIMGYGLAKEMVVKIELCTTLDELRSPDSDEMVKKLFHLKKEGAEITLKIKVKPIPAQPLWIMVSGRAQYLGSVPPQFTLRANRPVIRALAMAHCLHRTGHNLRLRMECQREEREYTFENVEGHSTAATDLGDDERRDMREGEKMLERIWPLFPVVWEFVP